MICPSCRFTDPAKHVKGVSGKKLPSARDESGQLKLLTVVPDSELPVVTDDTLRVIAG
jgi:hypothetical protein